MSRAKPSKTNPVLAAYHVVLQRDKTTYRDLIRLEKSILSTKTLDDDLVEILTDGLISSLYTAGYPVRIPRTGTLIKKIVVMLDTIKEVKKTVQERIKEIESIVDRLS